MTGTKRSGSLEPSPVSATSPGWSPSAAAVPPRSAGMPSSLPASSGRVAQRGLYPPPLQPNQLPVCERSSPGSNNLGYGGEKLPWDRAGGSAGCWGRTQP